jgi:glutamyl-tRNA synthetase
VLAAALSALEAVESWTHEQISKSLEAALVDGLGLKPRHAYGPVRVAITGSTVSPPLFESMEILGKARSLERLRAAQR